MAIGETFDLRAGLRSQLAVELDAAIVNATLPHRFEGSEPARIARMDDGAVTRSGGEVKRSAMLAARTVRERARVQHNQIARLRRHGVAIHTVPFVFTPELELEAVRRIGRRLAERV